ncbi:precorrin-3B C(17)-methyltransferase [Fodinicurvata sediminis]|uniref:precorrin-3B C(17)-methyltransferase n=1 Tax=Fodinicurvata sediminis TaxID=1121832 RepID=UPI00040352A1|nr:precorrin-3B C(17)-methyltransferase [Fodinicurvata sediminis]
MMEAIPGNAALLTLTGRGAELARRLQRELPGSTVHGLTGRVEDCDHAFSDTGAELAEIFAQGRPIIGICASGILIRFLGPLLSDKGTEPPVLSLAEDASSVVPLLGGHHGANRLARILADLLEGHAAITTAGDLNYDTALDEPPTGWRLGNPKDIKAFTSALMRGEKIFKNSLLPGFLKNIPQSHDGALKIALGPSVHQGGEACLVYHPAVLALGVGCERDCPPEELEKLVEETLRDAGLAPEAVALVASVDLKMDEVAVHHMARHLGVPARFFTPDRLETETPRLANPSKLVFQEVGCHGVAEAAALAAAGSQGTLVVTKHKSRGATCAVARAIDIIDPQAMGVARGRLSVVGIGPGRADWRTPEVTRMISQAEDLVGYGLYLDLLGPLAQGKTHHVYDLGQEEVRVKAALDLAAEGRNVALVSSGDIGIYAMATLVFELLERRDNPNWARIEIEVAPGVSAFQAMGARIGAPFGHDFCCISLSDLLTPWDAIERRLEAAAAGDFVIAFYNPVSRRRRHQLARAKEILLQKRPEDTPVVLGSNLGRQGEQLSVIRLADLEVDDVDMLTTVLVGSSQSRAIPRSGGGHWVYTPRGYAAKNDRMETAS